MNLPSVAHSILWRQPSDELLILDIVLENIANRKESMLSQSCVRDIRSVQTQIRLERM